MKQKILVLALLLLSLNLNAQTSISGVINTYHQVVGQDSFNNTITLDSLKSLAIGDSILIIQMQGATIDSSTTSSTHGSITAYNGAGNHEIALICDIIGNKLILDKRTLYQYDTNGLTQVVNIPSYSDVNVNGELTCKPWNGSKGGVLIFAAAGKVTLNDDINVDIKGFRAGTAETDLSSCSWSSYRTNYAYSSADDGGKKGEGIALYTSTPYGRGPQANGGGGGNDHNSGGGGGGHLNAGGKGGENGDPGYFSCKGYYPGLAGLGLSGGGKIFMGGGGGAGHTNNGEETDGGNGGGIIIIIADEIVGNGYTISARGDDVDHAKKEQIDQDGAGGGGAGGTIQLQVNTITGALTLDVSGGAGGTVDNEVTNRCYGPGGGGAGGVIISSITLPSGVSVKMVGGVAGITRRSTNSCDSTNMGATNGSAGTLSGGTLPTGNVNFSACVLPVEWLSFRLNPVAEGVELKWTTASEYGSLGFQLEHSLDGKNFKAIGYVNAAGYSSTITKYDFIHSEPAPGVNYYRIKQLDFDGQYDFSPVKYIEYNSSVKEIGIFPNPVGKEGFNLVIEAFQNGEATVNFYTPTGSLVSSHVLNLNEGRNVDHFDQSFISGIYFVEVLMGDQRITTTFYIGE